MLRALTTLSLLVITFLPIALAQGLGHATIYWPVLSPGPGKPWVIGQKNLLAWRCADGTGVKAFDIKLHNVNRKVLSGAIKIAFRFPMEPLPGRYKNLGGEIEVDLEDTIPPASGYVISFNSWIHGQTYAISEPFEIVAAPPSNYTDRPEGLPVATVSATITDVALPTDGWAVTLNGEMPISKSKSETSSGDGAQPTA